MKFLLVAPKQVLKGYEYGFPLGIGYISSSLKQAGYEVRCINMNNTDEPTNEVVRQAVEEFDPDVCGSGATSLYYNQINEAFTAAKNTKPSIVNVVGGGVLSSAPDIALGLVNADIGVVGEGEHTILDIAEALGQGKNLNGVQGIVFDDGSGEIVHTEARPANRELDLLPWPDYEGFEVEALFDAQKVMDAPFYHIQDDPRCISMVSSRSCPFSCTFCFHPNGRIYRERSIDNFFEEIDYLVERYDVNLLDICDELFATKKKRLIEFCERIKPYNISWTCQLHVSVVNEETLRLMKDAGCSYISYGLESANNEILKSMQKKTTRERYDEILGITYDMKIGIQGNFIFGDTAETVETANDTMDWWSNNRKYQINLSLLQAYPGSVVYERAVKEGIVDRKKDYLPQGLINITGMDDKDLGRLRERVLIFRETLVIPAKVLTFEKQVDSDPFRGDLYHIEWECPRCNHHNDFHNVTVDTPNAFQTLRMACRDCFTRFDIQNLARPTITEEVSDRMHQEATELQAQGKLQDAAEKYWEILNMEYPGMTRDRPRAYVKAAFDFGNMNLQYQRFDKAVKLYGIAVSRQSYDPAYHMAFAIALLADKSPNAAKLHYDTAQRLQAVNSKTSGNGVDPLDQALGNLGYAINESLRSVNEPHFFS